MKLLAGFPLSLVAGPSSPSSATARPGIGRKGGLGHPRLSWGFWFTFLLSLLVLCTALPVLAEEELTDGLYYTIVDERDQTLLETGLVVNVGDEVILADNRLYEVTSVDQNVRRAQARFLRQTSYRRPQYGLWSRIINWGKSVFTEAGRGEIAIYHTHTDESYVPTDGTAAKPAHGSVMKVGDSFDEALKKQGFAVTHDKTPHDPHDAMAYERSRRTAMKLLQKKPVALFDVHRDSAPASAYATQVGPAKATKVMIVVGRQNPNMQANLAFAQRLKAEVDRTHPGLIRGIFFGKGKYNQDLYPRALILEVGSEKNSLEEAEKGIAAVADAVPRS
ncbi:MAG: stage II sporulation protein P, partial [Firmicutes bacterium]|nr:stage II sporulation protein P [Bacillota bacterium]